MHICLYTYRVVCYASAATNRVCFLLAVLLNAVAARHGTPSSAKGATAVDKVSRCRQIKLTAEVTAEINRGNIGRTFN